MKWERVSLILTSAPWSTKNLMTSIEFRLIAIESGQSWIQNIFHNIMIYIKREWMPYNNDICDMKENKIL